MGESEKALTAFAVRRLPAILLLIVSLVWLTSQFTTTVMWGTVRGSTLMVSSEHRGWVFHILFQPLPQPFGLHSTASNRSTATRQSWGEHLTDSDATYQFSGIVASRTKRFLLLAVTHWLLFVATCVGWLLIHKSRLRKVSQSASPTN